MRWNGVFLLGCGVAAVGFVTAVAVQLADAAPLAHQRGMSIAIAMLACGALVACLGALMHRRRDEAPSRRRRGLTLFGADRSRIGTQKAAFGQRAAYGALPPPTTRTAKAGPAYRPPGEPVIGAPPAPPPLAITGPR